MSEQEKLLNEIHDFLQKSGMGPAYFSQQATGNPTVVRRLEAGRTITLSTAERIRAYIASPEERAKAYEAYLDILAARIAKRRKKNKKNGKKR